MFNGHKVSVLRDGKRFWAFTAQQYEYTSHHGAVHVTRREVGKLVLCDCAHK